MIKELKEMGLSQAMIAREMNTNRQTVNQWFTGERAPSARSIKRMAAAMSELTGRAIPPSEVYNLIAKVVERREQEENDRVKRNGISKERISSDVQRV